MHSNGMPAFESLLDDSVMRLGHDFQGEKTSMCILMFDVGA